MLERYQNQRIYHNRVTTVPLPGFDFVIYYAEVASQDLVIFEHYHNLYEIFYGLEGSALFTCCGEEVEVGPHSMFLLGKNYPHEYHYRMDSKALYFAIIFDIIPRKNAPCPEAETEYREIMEVLSIADKDHYIFVPEAVPHDVIIARITQTLSEKKIGWASQAGLYYYIFFLDLLQQIAKKPSSLAVPMGYENAALEATKYVHANLQSDLSTNIVASYLNVTSRHLSRLFQELFGSSFSHTVSTIRLGYAKKYLCETDESLENIAARVGFSSGKTLTKLFYEQEGMSPSLFRKLHNKR